ncbi:MAG: 4Fe-4S binding protein [Methanosarcinales archaeon]|nr:4Fe-4S binding protein [Methanosarcinales archaeon]
MINIDRYKCGYCGACVSVCPTDAIELVGTWIRIDEGNCNTCKACVNICPVGALELEPKKDSENGAVHNNSNVKIG